MMLIAKDSNGRLVYAWRARSNQKYVCPDCGYEVCLRTGLQKAAYFAHRRQTDCKNDVGESNLHMMGKFQMWQWASQHGWQPHLEVYLPAIKQRPDLLLSHHGQQIAMEFQCSPLSLKRLEERNYGYRELQLGFIWYLGPRYRHHLRSKKRAQFVQEYQGHPALFWWNLKRSQPQYQILDLPSPAKQTQLIRQLYQLRRYPRAHFALRNLCYESGHLLNCCPLVAHCNMAVPFLMRQSDFEWRLGLLLWLESMPILREWTTSGWLKEVDQQTSWQSCPCLTKAFVKQLHEQQLIEFTQELMRADIICRTRFGFYLKKRPQWFSDESNKMATIMALKQEQKHSLKASPILVE